MKKLLGMATLTLAFILPAHAQTVGDAVREGTQEVKKGAKEAHDVVWTRCANGRKTVKGKHGCDHDGGVAHPRPKPVTTPPPAQAPNTAK